MGKHTIADLINVIRNGDLTYQRDQRAGLALDSYCNDASEVLEAARASIVELLHLHPCGRFPEPCPNDDCPANRARRVLEMLGCAHA